MRKEHICLPFLVFVIFIAGCTQQLGGCKNDVITIEDYHLSSRTLYSGGRTGIDFKILNNGLTELDKVEVDFFDTSGFDISELKCERGGSANDKCTFENLYPDVRSVSLRLMAPSVNERTQYTVSFSVSYSDFGEREIHIPIIDGDVKSEPSLEYSISSQSCDPIHVDFEKEVKPEETKREYWTMIDMPFEMKFVFKHVGTVDGVNTLELEEGNVELSLINLQIQEPCDFDTSLRSKKAVEVTGDEKDRTLSCNFLPIASRQVEYIGVINVKYGYDYEYVKSETFTVYPSG